MTKQYLEIKEACEITFHRKYNIYDEDIIYDAMASIILQYNKNASSINDFRAWLFGAIHHHYSSFVRNKEKEKLFVFDEFILENIEDEAYPETRIDMEFVQKTIAHLDSPFKEILSLRLFEHRSHKEIAEILKINSSTVRKYYSRAIERITKKLKLSVTFFVFALLLGRSEII